jgi:hypothetical protein
MCPRRLIEIVAEWQASEGSPYGLAAMIAEAQREHSKELILSLEAGMTKEEIAAIVEQDLCSE